jgi:hypothetical protein
MGVIKFEELEVSLIFGGKKTEEETKVSLRRFSKFDFENSEFRKRSNIFEHLTVESS